MDNFCGSESEASKECRVILVKFVHIVDDDAMVRSAMSFLLGHLEIPNATYASGREFLDTADLDRGAVLLDLKMDDMDGLQVLQGLRDRGCTLPVILVSGHADIASAVGAMKLGAIDFLQKPYGNDDLLTALERCFALQADRSAHSAVLASATRKLQALSPRQQQILQGMVAGMTNKAMARHFRLSPRTVEMHRASTFDRLGAVNIADAIRIANAADLAKLPDEMSRER